ncbi:hypothetical protein [Chloroflexus islandicus]|uniref:hypothetical protein n=1 Tax=Chloroflexus islandicus TaxID=1707952 RepID=UPI0012E83C25|nr:hypothetical protein [Chloroflexus islandicus]
MLAIVATVAALWLFSPVLRDWTTVTASSDQEIIPVNDSWQNVWMLWWTAQAVMSGQSPFQTDMLFYPLKVDLFWQTLQVTNGLLALPVTLTFGPIAAYNTVALLTFVSSALTMFWLARWLGASAFAAGVVAMIYAFSPFHLTKLYDGQLEVMSIQYFPLLTLGLIALLQRAKMRIIACLLVGGLIVWILLTSLYYGLFALIYTAVVVGWYVLLARMPWRDYPVRVAQLILFLIPPALLLVANLANLPVSAPEVAALRMQGRSAQPIDFLLPSPYHPLWGQAVSALQVRLHPGVGMINISLGLVVWVIALIGLFGTWRERLTRLHLALVATFLILAMGPQLVWNGQPTGIPLPFGLIAEWPGVQAGQRPNHFIILAAVHLCLLAASGIETLLRRYAKYRFGLACGLIALIAFDLFPRPVPGSVMALSHAYRYIPPGAGAVLEVPFQMEFANAMVAQIQHQRPILGGYLARPPRYPFADAEGIAPLWLGEAHATILTRDWPQQLVEVMQAQNIEYVIVHERLLSEGQRRMAAQLATILDLVYRDYQTSLYRRRLPAQPDVTLVLGHGWHALEQNDAGVRWQWTQARAEIHAFNAFTEPKRVFLQIEMSAFQPPSTVTIRGAQPELTVNVSTQPRLYTVMLTLPPGHTTLTLAAEPVWHSPAEARLVGVMVQTIQAMVLNTGNHLP